MYDGTYIPIHFDIYRLHVYVQSIGTVYKLHKADLQTYHMLNILVLSQTDCVVNLIT